MTTMKLGTRQKIYCNACQAETNHELRFVLPGPYYEEIVKDPYPVSRYWDKIEYRLWSCLGCDTATFEEAITGEPMVDEEGNQIWTSTYHPKRAHQDLTKKYFRLLDKRLASVYQEIVESFNAGLRIVCAMGLRALLEGICVDKGITDGEAWGFEAKLRKLEERKLLPSHIVECLHTFKFMGDDAAHRLEAPSQDELRLAIGVMEELLNRLYEIDGLASKAEALAKMRSTAMAEFKKRKKASKVPGADEAGTP
jgi:hypothetical protein